MNKKLFILFFSIFLIFDGIGVVSSQNGSVRDLTSKNKKADSNKDDENSYVSNLFPDNENDLYKKDQVDLRSPSNINTKVEYDDKTGNYVISTYLENEKISTPIILTKEEYLDYQEKKVSSNYWRKKNAIDYNKKEDDFSLTDMHFDLGLGDKIFGKGGVRLSTQGSIETSFAIKNNKVDNPSLSDNAKNKTYFDFDQEIQMSVNGKVGDKINMNLNYDTQATFDYDAKSMKLKYEGKEDDIIKSIEAGNVSMPINSSLITGGSSLFGIKSELQFGKLSIASVLSQQKAKTKSVSLQGGAQTSEFQIDIDDYDENTHFFLSHFFKDHYDKWMEKLPYVSSGILINKVEVWVTNKSADLDDARNIVAFEDMGENEALYNNYWQKGTVLNPSNESNNLYSSLVSLYADARNFTDVNTTFAPLESSNVKIGYDYEKLESAKRLSESEYTLNSKLGYISLSRKLSSDEILAVAYEYTYAGKTYQVGEFSTGEIKSPKTLFVKLIKGTNLSPSMPTWDLMMKNVYSIKNAYNLKSDNFELNIEYKNDSLGVELPYINEGILKGKLLINVLNLDNQNTSGQAYPDGSFDYIEGYTVQSSGAKIIFPSCEPFGSFLKKEFDDSVLADKYIFQELYDSTLTKAKLFSEKNKFVLTGKYSASSGSTISLGAYNVARGSVNVTAGGRTLTENVDYTVDYISGTVTILNDELIKSGTPINATCEDQSSYSMMRKTMIGFNADYKFSDDFLLGGTFMRLTESPITNKVNMGSESVNNTIWGIHTSYKTKSQRLTNLVDKLPLVNITEPSTLKVNAEIAQLIASTSDKLGNVSYLDDFESSKKTYSLKDVNRWFLSSTPYEEINPKFPEASLYNDLSYNYNRALLSWYIVDGIFTKSTSSTPSNIKNDKDELSNQYVRAVKEQEIFPDKDISFNETGLISVMNLTFYPDERGPYNFNADDINADGKLNNPQKRWGGIMRKIDSGLTDFEESNVEYIEFWMMDPFVYDEDGSDQGGDMYIDLGDISEDVLKDGKRAFENGLAAENEQNLIDSTLWGKVSKKSSTAYSFDNTSGVREKQDVGLNGLNDSEEKTWPVIKDFLTKIKGKLSSETIEKMQDDPNSILNDPSGDDYHYYRGDDYDEKDYGILRRYKYYNGTSGNSKASSGSFSTASTTLPDAEDINLDFTLSETEKYYQYKVSLKHEDMKIGSNYITDIRNAEVQLKNGTRTNVKWYQFKIPISSYTKKEGDIDGFNSIRFMRLYLTDFKKQTTLRFATFDLVRGDWREYENSLLPFGSSVIPSSSTQTEVGTVSLEENSSREPINYVLPPGVEQETDPGQPGVYFQDERSLSLLVKNLVSGDAKGFYKNTNYDLRRFENLQLFIHAEKLVEDVNPPEDNEMSVFIRIGSDNKNNFYEYEIPLKLSEYYNNDEHSVWPEENKFDFPLSLLTDVKMKRNISNASYTKEYYAYDPNNEQNRITIKGNPVLSDVKTILIGIRNKTSTTKSVMIWANELRMSGFKNEGGYAATGEAVLNLSDLATMSAAGRYESAGFGGLEQSVTERRMDDYSQYSFSFGMDLGKLLPSKVKFVIPYYFTYSKEKSLPKYDPLNNDLILDKELSNVEGAEKDSILKSSETVKTTRGFTFSNVQLNVKSKVPMPYDPANFSFNYSFNENEEHDPTTEYKKTQNFNGGVSYAYSSPLRPWKPFEKSKTSNSSLKKFYKEFNLNFVPNNLTFSSNLVRFYYEMQNSSFENASDYSVPVVVNKSFLWNSSFGMNWNITKNLKTSFSVNNKAKIEETKNKPVNEELYKTEYEQWKDTVMQSLKNFGTPLEYSQTANVSYNVPLFLFPFTDFLTLNTQYTSNYTWERSADIEESLDLGNVINNQKNIVVNFSSDMNKLYNKSDYLKRINRNTSQRKSYSSKKKSNKFEQELVIDDKNPITVIHKLESKKLNVLFFDSIGHKIKLKYKIKDKNTLEIKSDNSGKYKLVVSSKPGKEVTNWSKLAINTIKLATSLKSFSLNYSKSNGLNIPGFKEESNLWSGKNSSAPGWDYALGLYGDDYVEKAISKDWLIMNDSISTPIYETYMENLQGKISFEFFKYLKVDLDFTRQWSYNNTIQYMYEGMPTSKTGNFTISTICLGSAFEGINADNNYSSKVFDEFVNNRDIIASRLETKYKDFVYPNQGFIKETLLGNKPYDSSIGSVNKNSSDVLIPAFIAAYTGRDASSSSLNIFPSLAKMLPNWKISYSGLSKLDIVKKYFRSLSLTHGYTSTYTVSSFSSNNTFVNASGDYGFIKNTQSGAPTPSSLYNISSVSLVEAFNPLISLQGTLKSGLTLRSELRTTRNINLSISGGQVVEAKQSQYVLGSTYKISNFHPFGFFSTSKIQNDLNVTSNISYNSQASVLRKIEEMYSQASSGNKTFSIELMADYKISRNLSMKGFYNLESSMPLVSSYPVRTQDFGFSLRFSLSR